VQPGPLEDADMEDEEDPYDWYTLPRALQRVDKSTSNTLLTACMASISQTSSIQWLCIVNVREH